MSNKNGGGILDTKEHDFVARLLPLVRRLRIQVRRSNKECYIQVRVTAHGLYIDEMVKRGFVSEL